MFIAHAAAFTLEPMRAYILLGVRRKFNNKIVSHMLN